MISTKKTCITQFISIGMLIIISALVFINKYQIVINKEWEKF